ncbi:MAG: NAD(P)H-dependent glycerol-3-phosphate dehydrogenase [Candidatus Pacebacteria bacterium]|nr:NAD(P)H-dependent glycerol-3-phosphate dehydrogenase [Candidatus Paceibacterota bacterium]
MKSEAAATIAIIGAGAWGTALAQVAARAAQHRQSNRGIVLYSHRAEVAEELSASRQNRRYLDGIILEPTIQISHDLTSLDSASTIVLAVPSDAILATVQKILPHIRAEAILVSAAKGLAAGSGARMSEVIRQLAPPSHAVAALSGPGFAREVAMGQPTAVTLAAETLALAESLGAEFASRSFRPYPSDDLIGTEIGGVAKNVIAIACGIAIGMGFGDNVRAALITRGLAEITRYGLALGGKAETLAGLAGVGDLVLTCSGNQSRNLRFGMALGQGRGLDSAEAEFGTVEGIKTALTMAVQARSLDITMPICDAVATLLRGEIAVGDAVESLLSRPIPKP